MMTCAAALREFESTRKPYIEEYQAAALESMLWFENVRQYIRLSPIELAYSLMMRSGRVDHEELKKRDRSFCSSLRGGNFVGASLRGRLSLDEVFIKGLRPILQRPVRK